MSRSRTFFLSVLNDLDGSTALPDDLITEQQPTLAQTLSTVLGRVFFPFRYNVPAGTYAPGGVSVTDLGQIDPMKLWRSVNATPSAPDNFVAQISVSGIDPEATARIVVLDLTGRARFEPFILPKGITPFDVGTRYNVPLIAGDQINIAWDTPPGPGLEGARVVVALHPVETVAELIACCESASGDGDGDCTNAAGNYSFGDTHALAPGGSVVNNLSAVPPLGFQTQFAIIVEEGNEYIEAQCDVIAQIDAFLGAADGTNPPVAAPGTDFSMTIVADGTANPTTVRARSGATLAPFDAGAARATLQNVALSAVVSLNTGDRIGVRISGDASATSVTYQGGISVAAVGCCDSGGDGDGEG